MGKLPDECVFGDCVFRIDRPNSAVTRFTLSRSPRPRRLLTSAAAGLAVCLALTWSFFWAGLLLGLWLLATLGSSGVVEESAEVFAGVALQLSTKYADGSASHRMVPMAEISEVVLNETAAGFYVRTYLAVLPKRIGAKSIIPFEHTDIPLWLSSRLLFALRTALA